MMRDVDEVLKSYAADRLIGLQLFERSDPMSSFSSPAPSPRGAQSDGASSGFDGGGSARPAAAARQGKPKRRDVVGGFGGFDDEQQPASSAPDVAPEGVAPELDSRPAPKDHADGATRRTEGASGAGLVGVAEVAPSDPLARAAFERRREYERACRDAEEAAKAAERALVSPRAPGT
eukprot:7110061-Prymnesium_polylepis.1